MPEIKDTQSHSYVDTAGTVVKLKINVFPVLAL